MIKGATTLTELRSRLTRPNPRSLVYDAASGHYQVWEDGVCIAAVANEKDARYLAESPALVGRLFDELSLEDTQPVVPPHIYNRLTEPLITLLERISQLPDGVHYAPTRNEVMAAKTLRSFRLVNSLKVAGGGRTYSITWSGRAVLWVAAKKARA